MSPDDLQPTMKFLLNQQAQAAADLAAHTVRFDAAIEQLTKKTDRVVDAVLGLAGVVGNVASQQERTAEQLRETNQQLRELATRQERTDEQLRDLGEYVRTVDSNLGALVDMFERHLREDHGQRPS